MTVVKSATKQPSLVHIVIGLAWNTLGVVFESNLPRSRNVVKAAAAYRKAARLGLAAGQANLARLYGEGRGVAQDYTQARLFAEKAANAGHRWSQNYLGYLMSMGLGGKALPDEAIDWYEKAAIRGSADAQFNLGWCHESGTGLKSQDIRCAIHWYRKAARQGHGAAQYNLGVLLLDEKKTESDAIVWLTRAKQKGIPEAAALLESRQMAKGSGRSDLEL